MKRITHISRLRNCGVFRDFEWPSNLPEFGQYNLLYGWNGTGKTTLSRLFRDLELSRQPTMGEVALRTEDSDIQGDYFPESNLHVRVFNQDFIQENVFPVGGEDMPPIFVLGTENVEKQKEVERLKRRRNEAIMSQLPLHSTQQTADKNFDQFCIDRAKVIKDTLRSSGQSPYNKYNNYDKSNFQSDAVKMVEAGDSTTYHLTDEKRMELLAQHMAMPKQKVPELTYVLPDFNAIMGRLSELLMTTVVSAAIKALKDDHELAEWTRQGLELHRDQSTKWCLFCEQLLPEGRLAALETHFSTQYEQFTQRVDREINELKTKSKAAAELRVPAKAEFYDHLGPKFESVGDELTKALDSTKSFLNAAVQALRNKKHRVFEHVKMEFEIPPVHVGTVEKLNIVIRQHNQTCDEFETRVEGARRQLAKDMIATELEEFRCRKDAASQAKADMQMKRHNVWRLSKEIEGLEKEIIEHRQPAEELNKDLYDYLGHPELYLEIKETGYSITRSGTPAESLSEGEATAIALLYFLKSLQDLRFILENGIIVLDDPVSSLDANALFLAFGFIQRCTTGAGQLFVLTHNFSFFRQVHNWFHHLSKEKKPVQFFMLNSTLDGNARSSAIRELDPLLRQYESEYHYLFAYVYRASTKSTSPSLKQNYFLPNVARRILEAFLAFRLPQISGSLWKRLQKVKFEDAKKRRIYRFLHTHSHSVAVGESEHDLTALAEGPSVLKDLLEMVKSMDNEHYLAMVQLVKDSDKEIN